jgi:predicted SnoaL-like aldol condensation-catalyzing enzyme
MHQVETVNEINKQKIRLFVQAVLNEGRLELIDELVAADYMGHLPCAEQTVVGRDELRRRLSAHRLSRPDLYIKIEDEIAEDDLVVIRWRATASTAATHVGADYLPWSSGISIIRLLAGRQVDAYTAMVPSATGLPARPTTSRPSPIRGPRPSSRP